MMLYLRPDIASKFVALVINKDLPQQASWGIYPTSYHLQGRCLLWFLYLVTLKLSDLLEKVLNGCRLVKPDDDVGLTSIESALLVRSARAGVKREIQPFSMKSAALIEKKT
jgi:hypothetical protein